MRTHPLHAARARLSSLIDRAIAGEPQRVTRHGKDAVVIVAEAEWRDRPKSAPTMADLFALTLGAEDTDDLEIVAGRPWKRKSSLGAEFAD